MTDGIYHTISGSSYEIAGSRMRRLIRGPGSKAERPGAGEWRPFEDVQLLPSGQIFFVWGMDCSVEPPVVKGTLTSLLVPVGVPE